MQNRLDLILWGGWEPVNEAVPLIGRESNAACVVGAAESRKVGLLRFQQIFQGEAVGINCGQSSVNALGDNPDAMSRIRALIDHRLGEILWAASLEVMTGYTSKSTRSFQFAIHWSRSERSSVSISWERRSSVSFTQLATYESPSGARRLRSRNRR